MLAFDRTISQFIANIIPHNYYMDSLFSFFALRGITFYIWVLPIILLLIYEKIHSRVFLLRIIAAFGAGSIIFSSIKLLVARSRPFLDGVTLLVNEPLSFQCPSDFSFPSGHATLAFAIATVLAQTDKKRRILYYAIACLVALSRIYLQCHYISDVLVGIALGYGIGKGVCRLIRSTSK